MGWWCYRHLVQKESNFVSHIFTSHLGLSFRLNFKKFIHLSNTNFIFIIGDCYNCVDRNDQVGFVEAKSNLRRVQISAVVVVVHSPSLVCLYVCNEKKEKKNRFINACMRTTKCEGEITRGIDGAIPFDWMKGKWKIRSNIQIKLKV